MLNNVQNYVARLLISTFVSLAGRLGPILACAFTDYLLKTTERHFNFDHLCFLAEVQVLLNLFISFSSHLHKLFSWNPKRPVWLPAAFLAESTFITLTRSFFTSASSFYHLQAGLKASHITWVRRHRYL